MRLCVTFLCLIPLIQCSDYGIQKRRGGETETHTQNKKVLSRAKFWDNFVCVMQQDCNISKPEERQPIKKKTPIITMIWGKE